MKLASKLLMGFVGPTLHDCNAEKSLFGDDISSNYSSKKMLFSVTAHVERVELIISDPVMGLHRPILSICFPSLLLTASQLQVVHHGSKETVNKLVNRGVHDHANDLQACMEATIFMDYFKLGLTRNWEPFIEPFRCLMLYEKSASRGKGITFNADCPLHMNITGEYSNNTLILGQSLILDVK